MIAKIMKKMVEYSQGNHHDINHFMKVWTYAKTIGELEGLAKDTQYILEIAAITHDIACPLCRSKYGNTNPIYQEKEGMLLVRDFLEDLGIDEEVIERVVYLVGHHHTLTDIDGLDYQILIEADYLVNAYESQYKIESIKEFSKHYFKTKTGLSLLESLYNC